MNQSENIPNADEALRAISGLAESYSSRAKASVSNGARTTSFDSAASEYNVSKEALHGDTPPSQALSHEQPVHILMCYMQASGKTIAEIAQATGYSVGGVRVITKQPWFRKRFLRITSEAGKNQVESFLASETMNSLEVLVQIRDDETEKGPTRVTAANSILDRALGKAVQHVESTSNLTVNKATDAGQSLDAQIAALTEQLRHVGSAPRSLPGSS